jgi:hypothetical protein
MRKNAEILGMIRICYKAKNEDLSKSHVSMNLGAGNEIPRKPTIEKMERNEGAEKGNKKQKIPLLPLPFF